RYEIEREALRPAENAALKAIRPCRIVKISVGVLVSVGDAQFVSRVEVVIDLGVDLLSCEIPAGSEHTLCAAIFASCPTNSGSVQSIADFVVIRRRHRA